MVPFPTIEDDIAFQDIQQVWFGEKENKFRKTSPLMTQETYEILESAWGEPAVDGFQIVEQDEILDYAWQEQLLGHHSF